MDLLPVPWGYASVGELDPLTAFFAGFWRACCRVVATRPKCTLCSECKGAVLRLVEANVNESSLELPSHPTTTSHRPSRSLSFIASIQPTPTTLTASPLSKCSSSDFSHCCPSVSRLFLILSLLRTVEGQWSDLYA